MRTARKELRSLEVEGNNGGSFVRIEETARAGVAFVEVGHECCIRFSGEVRVEDLAELLGRVADDGAFKPVMA